MPNKPATRAQIVALLAQFAAIRRDGDARAHGPRGNAYAGDERECRLAWAEDHLGHARGKLESFNDLDGRQASYLLDIAHGKLSALDKKLGQEWQRLGVNSPPDYFTAMLTQRREVARLGKLGWCLRGRQLRELDRVGKWRLVQILTSRPTPAPPPIGASYRPFGDRA